MFTPNAQTLMDRARDRAFAMARSQVECLDLLAAACDETEALVRLAECLTGGDVTGILDKRHREDLHVVCRLTLPYAPDCAALLEQAWDLASAQGVPDDTHPGLVDLKHLVCALASSNEVCRALGGCSPITRETALQKLAAWYDLSARPSSLGDMINRLRGLRNDLLSKVFGQDHAVHTFIEGLYNAELTSAIDPERVKPEAVFVFAGPPGVGKTYLAELCASFLGRPFKRFDLTGYSDHQAHNQLVGFPAVYKGAQPGLLTGFVDQHPNAILLFDEIEKAHLNVIQLFYQILDAGHLEDKHLEKDVPFRDAIMILTTNAGRTLYDNPNRAGIQAANANYHRRTILNALENEKHPVSGQPAFPQAICSRLAQGFPVVFNHLGVNELVQVCDSAMFRLETLLERQYYKSISHDPLVPITLVLREGSKIDPRQLRAETEKFLKNEIFKYVSLHSRERLDELFGRIKSIRLEIEAGALDMSAETGALLRMGDKPRVLLAAGQRIASLYQEHVPEVHWFNAATPSEVMDILAGEEVDMILLDIWVRREFRDDSGATQTGANPLSQSFMGESDYVPLSARALDEGREILRLLHERAPQLPVYLLSLGRLDPSQTIFGEGPRRPVDDELFLACVRSGGARGMVSTSFTSLRAADWELQRDALAEQLTETNLRLYREKKAATLAAERKVLGFDTASRLDHEAGRLSIRLRNFSLIRAVDAQDAGEMVEEISRPTTRFADVFGAKTAKESLQFIIDWLKNPKPYALLGIRPPKGILLTGPPGTGKTMLARAVAGESDCAFLEKSASGFVTVWQGSGPQNVRDLFARARRYAPAIVFIDEIDSIGLGRTGQGGAARTQEETLNALLTEMDGFRVSQQPIIVLAATNLADKLDEALKRRFDRVVEVDRPDRAARLEYLRQKVAARKNHQVAPEALERVAKQTAHWTIADLERMLQEAAVMAAQQGQPLTGAAIEEAFEKVRSGEIREQPDRAALERTARHESGHALIAWLGGNPPIMVDIIGRGDRGGVMVRESEEQGKSYQKGELEQTIREALAGRAAELLYYGPESGLTTGASSDLKFASGLAKKMISHFGMSQEFGHVSVAGTYHEHASDGPLAVRELEMVKQLIAGQMERTMRDLTAHRALLDRLSGELLEKNRLTTEEMRGILGDLKDGASEKGESHV